MLDDKNDSWFKWLADDSPRLIGCGRCIPKLTTRRHRERLCFELLSLLVTQHK